MMKKFFQQTRKPQGFLGRLMLRSMNFGHNSLSAWGIDHLRFSPGARILDIGCGGGANIHTFLKTVPDSIVDGIDYSGESVAFSKKKNMQFLGKRCTIRQGSAADLPYADNTLNIVTAFETVYFWNNLDGAFREVLRVLNPGGIFMICCEADDPSDTTWTSRIEGMTIYSAGDLGDRLRNSGFCTVNTDRNRQGWICIVAVK